MNFHEVIEEAIERFGGQEDGVFTTACFQSALKSRVGILEELHVVEPILKNHPRVCRLRGGCHWKYSGKLPSVWDHLEDSV